MEDMVLVVFALVALSFPAWYVICAIRYILSPLSPKGQYSVGGDVYRGPPLP